MRLIIRSSINTCWRQLVDDSCRKYISAECEWLEFRFRKDTPRRKRKKRKTKQMKLSKYHMKEIEGGEKRFLFLNEKKFTVLRHHLHNCYVALMLILLAALLSSTRARKWRRHFQTGRMQQAMPSNSPPVMTKEHKLGKKEITSAEKQPEVNNHIYQNG